MNENLEMWSFIVGTFMPLLTAIPIQHHWSNTTRTIFGTALSIIAAVVTIWLEHGLHLDSDFVTAMLTVIVASYATYRNFWKPTGITTTVETKVLNFGPDTR